MEIDLDEKLAKQSKEALLREFKDMVENSMFHSASDIVDDHPTADCILDLEKYRIRANKMAAIIYDLPNIHERPLDSIEDAVYLVKTAAPNMSWWRLGWNGCQGHYADLDFDVRVGNKNETYVYSTAGRNGAAAIVQALIKYLDDKTRLDDLHEAAMKKGNGVLENA